MNLDQLTSELQRLAAFEAVRNRLLGDPGHPATVSVADAAKPYVLAALHAALDRPLLLITARPSQARSLREEIACWHPRPSSVLLFPEQDILPFEPLPADQQTTAERLSVLTRLVQAPPVDPRSPSPPLVIVCARAACRRPISASTSSAAPRTTGLSASAIATASSIVRARFTSGWAAEGGSRLSAGSLCLHKARRGQGEHHQTSKHVSA